MKKILLAPFYLLGFLVGRFRWSPPHWLTALYSFLKSHLKITAALILLISTVIGVYYYLDSKPRPISSKAAISEIRLASTNSRGEVIPSSITVNFTYDYEALHDDQPRPQGTPSVARIDLLGKKVDTGIILSPNKKGTWRWVNDNTLEFQPETHWPAGTKYALNFDETVFSDDTYLSSAKYSFSTPELSAKFNSTEFFQDPTDPSIRRVISTIEFTHPIEHDSVKQALSLGMQPKKANSAVLKKHDFDVTFSKNNRYAYIQSTPVTLPKEPNYMRITLNKGVKSVFGGNASSSAIENKQLIPDVYSFLKVSYVTASIIRNQNNEPEQVITIEFTDAINEETLLNKLSLYRLPSYKRSANQVDEKVLANSEAITLKLIPNPRSSSTIFNFVIDQPERASLYLKVDEKLTSVNNFVYNSSYETILSLPEYPREASILGEGSVLSASGDQQLTVLTRGLPALKYSVGQLLNNQINHLVTQTRGDISSPYFKNWDLNEQHISEFDSSVVELNKLHPKRANYSSFDLSDYLPEENSRFGLFFIKINGWDNQHDRQIYGTEDKRLILITDLGIIVKDNVDGSHDIFVQSIANGEPVAGATIELLGANGIPVISITTNQEGHANIQSSRGYQNEKQPSVYVVKTANDVSFIPYDRAQRRSNFSRFDIGGERSSSSQNGLNGFLFSDRGIYRPGETVNIGMIVKNNDLSNVENLPLEIAIRNPRGKEVESQRYTLDEMGFSEFQYPTETTDDTGNYSATLYLIRESNRRKYRAEQIGYTNFSVEEFQPDTLKISNTLENTTEKGWNTAKEITALTQLNNLFGTPAQNRKVTADLVISPTKFSFKQFANYRFSDNDNTAQQRPLQVRKTLEPQTTDADGLAKFILDLNEFKSGTYNLVMNVEGFEQGGGRSVKAINSILISPQAQLIGFKPDGALNFINANTKRSVNFIAINPQLTQLALSDLTLKRIHVQTVSTLVKQPNGTYRYQSIKKEVELDQQAFTIPQKGIDFALQADTPGDYAIEIYDQQDQRLSRLDYSVAGFANLTGSIDKNAELELKLEKPDYAVGDEISMSIKAPYIGAGLITIEQDKVYAYKWFKTDQQSSVQSITLPDGIEGTAYINVSFIRDAGSKEIYTSPLSYAVAPFSIDRSKRRIDISLDHNEIVRPGKAMKIGYSTSKPSKIVVFAINEGILQVANYSTPAPLDHYLKKQALEVQTQQILDLILPEFNLETLRSASGGGARLRAALAKNLNPFARKLDKPAVFWSGLYDADQTQRHVDFEVPNTFSGQLRVMAVAVSDSAFGATSQNAIVRGPFVISPNVLTSAAPGDEFDVTVGVANLIDGSGEHAKISLSAKASEHLEIIGKTQAEQVIGHGNEGKFTFRVKAKQRLGAAELSFTAQHKDESLKRSASLSVRPAMPYYTDFIGGFSDKKTLTIDNQRPLYANLADQSISASASPLVVIDGLSSYLNSYPHGCTEQVVSKVFPIVGLLSHPAYAPHQPDIRESFNALTSKLGSRQMSDGGFSFWPKGNRSSVYPSIYAMHFLIDSKEYGYPVSNTLLDRGESYLLSVAQKSANNQGSGITIHRNRANAIYLLTRMGTVTSNYLIDLEDDLNKSKIKDWKKDITASYMAATYQMLEKDSEAERLIRGYRLDRPASQIVSSDFGSKLTLDSQYIYLLSKHFEKRARKLDGESILSLTAPIYKGEYNTIASAYTILALGAYSKLVLGDNTEESIEFSAIDHAQKSQILDAIAQPFLTTNYSVKTKQLKLAADNDFYYLNVQSGFNSTLPEKAVKQGLEIYREFVDAQGNDITEFKQGEEITVKLKVRTTGGQTISNIAIIDLLPGGFEVIRSSVSRVAYNWRADYVDIREDRINYYGSFGKRVTELTYKVKLTASGEFVIPPLFAESMYDRSIKAMTKASTITVNASQ